MISFLIKATTFITKHITKVFDHMKSTKFLYNNILKNMLADLKSHLLRNISITLLPSNL